MQHEYEEWWITPVAEIYGKDQLRYRRVNVHVDRSAGV